VRGETEGHGRVWLTHAVGWFELCDEFGFCWLSVMRMVGERKVVRFSGGGRGENFSEVKGTQFCR